MLGPILRFVFPVRCITCGVVGGDWCKKCQAQIQTVRAQSSGLIAHAQYVGVMKDAIHAWKYGHAEFLTRAFARMLSKTLLPHELGTNPVIVPVPMTNRKRRKRGYNQVEQLGNALARKLRIPLWQGLHKIKETRAQAELHKQERERNVLGAFTVRNVPRNRPDTILLLDDVLTTGATLSECTKTLQTRLPNARILPVVLCVKDDSNATRDAMLRSGPSARHEQPDTTPRSCR